LVSVCSSFMTSASASSSKATTVLEKERSLTGVDGGRHPCV
jgi:hypothetical protein